MQLPLWLQVGTAALFLAVLAADFFIVDRRPHAFSVREATRWVAAYVGLAGLFALVIWQLFDHELAMQFTAAYLTEYSLSVDNLFVFLVIMGSFSVPPELQHRVLLVGVLIALALRAVLIVLGVAIVTKFTAVFIGFGLFLLWTAVKVGADREEDAADIRDKSIMRLVSRMMPTHHQYDGHRVFTRIDGVRHLTPMALVMVAIGFTDIMFALDSIPAVLGLTSETFLVLTSNAFALMGLRQLYFLLNGLIERLIHLARGLAVILAFIGVKLLLMGFDAVVPAELPHISTTTSLAVIAVVLAVTTFTSLRATSAAKAIEADRD